MVCVRTAWLEYPGGPTVYLENAALGYFCSSLDLGMGAPREVIDNKPDRDGADDRTQFMGPRTVTVAITAILGAGARVDDVATSFSPFMVPSVRSNLHYVLDRGTNPERVISGLRVANYDWPVVGPDTRDIALQWIASDPVARDPAVKVVTSWAGVSGGGAGRTYPLNPPRVYPTSGGGSVSGVIHPAGDLGALPVLDIYGPVTSAVVTVSNQPYPGGGFYSNQVKTVTGYVIPAGHFLRVDTSSKDVWYDGDHQQPSGSAIDWQSWLFPPLTPGTDHLLQLAGSTTTSSTQVQATWQDGYLV